ncbi:MAG TPA: hypothetical protein VHJ20_21600 [Polyangia bacterium]|nr:hypothetical protein [Polyangia bacterium]
MRARNAALALALTLIACDGPGNVGKPTPDPTLVRDVPWLNGVLPALDATGNAVVPDLPVYPEIASGEIDVGSQRIDCTPLAQVTFSTGWFDTFEPNDPSDPTRTGLAPGWASYDDLTKYSFHVPGDATWYPGLAPGGTNTFDWAWGLPAEKTPGPSCNGVRNDWVMHYRGGLYRKWGGGVSHAFVDPVGKYCTLDKDGTPDNDFCPPTPGPNDLVDSAGLPVGPRPGVDYQQSHGFFDVSSYDGIAFWARRGPEGFDRALVIVTDKFTSSRLARENQKFCRRYRECHTKCLSGSPCSPDDPNSKTPIYRCFDPKQGPLPAIAIDSQMDLMYPRCGPSACTSPQTYVDLDFDGDQCRPYSFPANDESGEYCFNPGDPPPPDRDDRCQDGWQVSVPLTPDWQFYALPFEQFEQVGFGKRAPYMDLKSLDTIAFGAVMGWSDMYFDNVTFYRRKK